jgi:hypothetical protein
MPAPDAVHNERVKLTANLFNTMANSCFAVGVVAPLAAAVFYSPAAVPMRAAVVGAATWLFAATVLHFGAQHLIGKLRI